jgi:hypothetical protein
MTKSKSEEILARTVKMGKQKFKVHNAIWYSRPNYPLQKKTTFGINKI